MKDLNATNIHYSCEKVYKVDKKAQRSERFEKETIEHCEAITSKTVG